ncbi:MAG: hypothetical protein ABJK64_09490 [Paraglaciecola sp.]|uniref:hypothetical protein n=1 Tax=Paraglaciecola sp. TaxID=1920173 RepID=UPI0032990791
MAQSLSCKEIIDQSNYPIDEVDNPKRQEVIEQVRAQLAVDGCGWLCGGEKLFQ